MYADALVQPWLEILLRETPGIDLFDIHTHIGQNDPSGFHAELPELREALARVGARAAVFPLSEPEGYSAANDKVIDVAADDPALVPFCRISPHDHPVREADRCVERGAAGIKLHPASDEFTIDDERLTGVFDLAEARRLPVLAHAGPENKPFGDSLTDLLTDRPELRFIVAHAGLTDLSCLAGRAADFPNLFFDTSWWSPTDLVLLLGTVPPGQVLFGSDLPYSTPLWGAHAALRCARYAGLDPAQIRSVMGGQARRLVERADVLDQGPAPGPPPPLDLLLERLYVYLAAGVEATKRGEGPEQMLDLAKHCCRVPADHPHVEVFASVEQLLDRYADHELTSSTPYAPGWDLITAAAMVARTPGPPLP
ncbi:amidohydrolase family protein [Saccharothrix sp. AJ9571]|nr:amidohydrolase family protein [Saccharothrix sp. AJ9571]